MADIEKLGKLAIKKGFTHAAALDADTLIPRQEVRDMCAEDKCRAYGKNWSCPPGCGTLEECAKRMKKYRTGILVQTVGELEDETDWEEMMELNRLHREHFLALEKELRKEYPDMLAMGSGGCDRCKSCTYPDAPCRFPKEIFSSMEANGLMVSEVCKANGMEYYYGPNTLAYTSCFLLE